MKHKTDESTEVPKVHSNTLKQASKH